MACGLSLSLSESSDVSRLTYIIRESYNKKSNVWTYDKKGTQTKKIIIEPALNYLREKLFDYCKKNSGSIKESILKHMITATEVIQLIDSGLRLVRYRSLSKLADDIVRYIAPEFYIKQIEPNEMKQIEGLKETSEKIKDIKPPNKTKTKSLNKPNTKIITKTKTKISNQDSEQEFMQTLRELKMEQKNLFVD